MFFDFIGRIEPVIELAVLFGVPTLAALWLAGRFDMSGIKDALGFGDGRAWYEQR